MLRIFLTVSVLFWNQLAAQNAVNKILDLCEDVDCFKPIFVMQGENYDVMKFKSHQWVETEVSGMDMESALEIGLEKLFNYVYFNNSAGTIVPVAAPWGVLGRLENGTMQQSFVVYRLLLPEIAKLPEPLDDTVQLGSRSDVWFYVRAFDDEADEDEIENRVAQFQKDLEQDNQSFGEVFRIALYTTRGLMFIAFERTEEAEN
ncbi:heme-binding protein 2-like [Scyliorhinus torazame]|uniref:heme-binding protein 2-like n=1 Tax=Scyliorhinus torazame TaxID=75743 RepID=UPI003B5B3D3A